jgi:hypothetical protein
MGYMQYYSSRLHIFRKLLVTALEKLMKAAVPFTAAARHAVLNGVSGSSGSVSGVRRCRN